MDFTGTLEMEGKWKLRDLQHNAASFPRSQARPRTGSTGLSVDVAGVALWGSQGHDDPKRQVEVTRTFLA